MTTVGIYKDCVNYMIRHDIHPYSWHPTEKSLVYYEYGFNGSKGARVVVPFRELVL